LKDIFEYLDRYKE
jgi:hypothetical protein